MTFFAKSKSFVPKCLCGVRGFLHLCQNQLLLCFFCIMLSHSYGAARTLQQSPVPINLTPRVFSGVEAPEGRFPYMCSIQRRSTESHVCGGVLIGSEWVMTAAHCFESNDGFSVVGTPIVRCGIHERKDRNETKTFSPEYICRHKKWNGAVADGSDILLLKLNKKTDLPFPLLDAAFSEYDDGITFGAPGWGLMTPNSQFANVLQVAASLPFVELETCNQEDKWDNTIKQSMICAGHLSEGTCVGDSGGPLLHLNYKSRNWSDGNPKLDTIVGITSYGDGQCDDKRPGIYTRVSSFTSWIKDTIENGACLDDTDPPKENESSPPIPITAEPAPSDPPQSEISSDSEIAPGSLISPSTEIAPDSEAPESRIAPESEMSDVNIISSPGDDDYCTSSLTDFELCLDTICPRSPTVTRLENAEIALEADDEEAIQDSICCGLDVDEKRAPSDCSLLCQAAKFNSPSSTKVLIQNEADIDEQDEEGMTAVSHAVVQNSLETLKVLITCGADLEKDNDEDQTPLHLAAASGLLSAAEMLVDNGASFLAVDDNGKTPYDLICSENTRCTSRTRVRLQELLV